MNFLRPQVFSSQFVASSTKFLRTQVFNKCGIA